MMLPLDSGPKLAVGQWVACWAGLPWGGNSLCCLIIFVIFIGLGRPYSLGKILKLGAGGGGEGAKKG